MWKGRIFQQDLWILWYIFFMVFRHVRRYFAFVAIAVVLTVPQAPPAVLAQALPAAAYAASTDRDAGEVRLAPGEERLLRLTFVNAGSAPWSVAGGAALYVYGDSSPFRHSSWRTADFIAPLVTPSVAPGNTASASFFVRAPVKAGTYSQDFVLGHGGNIWIKGSRTTVRFVVSGTPVSAASSSSGSAASAASVPVPNPTAPISRPVASSIASGFKAELVDRGGIEWQLEPLARATIRVKFRNAGTATWGNAGAGAVSLGPTGGRKSDFQDEGWKSSGVAAVLQETRVAPGGIGTFVVTLRGATKPGTFNEAFSLFSGTSVFEAGSVSFPVRVTVPLAYIVNNVPEGIANGVDPALVSAQAASAGGDASADYRTVLLLRSISQVVLTGNARQPLTLGFKNTGTATWRTMAIRLEGLVPAINEKWASLRDETWATSLEPVRSSGATAPGNLGFLSFKMKVPAKRGTYTARFRLYADERPVTDGLIDIPITVTADGYIEPEPVLPPPTPVKAAATGGVSPTGNAPLQSSVPSFIPQPLSGDPASLPAEPIIRVGLFKTVDDQMKVRAVRTGMWLSEGGNRRCAFSQGQEVLVRYDRGSRQYRVSGPGCDVSSSSHFQLKAEDGLSPLEMTDFSRPVAWLPGANDNTFRSTLELRYAPKTDSVWTINELPIEWYLKGMAETSNVSPAEFQRTLMTAARTYAVYHVQRGTKHADEFYIVDATYDQVYRGYGAEARTPNVVAAVDATRGQIVTYNGKLAITPYFSRSDGRTRSWTEVWGGGPYPWLVGVPVPQDAGKTLWGHGVGMSATGALGMANEGRSYVDILKHFYQGTELRLVYR